MSKETDKSKGTFAFSKQNYIFLAAGVLVVIIGFLLMSGGKSDDPSVFNEEVFSARRITLAPIVVLLGYAFIVWAIMKKPGEKHEEAEK
ncbi:MAG: hypothetical protein A2W91_13035 [Bacteroidetes bacterium GWF2_38_335]|nr:MAG: hypothetical protein A2W91_13035 [Bacteroidetes bacterium GWF2_38_335]HBS85820.1 DUF3098 domain-containing protein [Bacteroidales bacterium]